MPCTTIAVDHYGLGVIEASVLEQSDNFENKDMNEFSERDKRYKSETKNDKSVPFRSFPNSTLRPTPQLKISHLNGSRKLRPNLIK